MLDRILLRLIVLLAAAALVLLALPGCTAQQVERAESAAAKAEQVLDQAQAVVQIAQQAVAAAQKIGNAEALTKAQQALDVANAALPGLQATATAARETASAAKQASEAGGSWLTVVLSVAGTLVPLVPIVAVSVQRTIAATRQSTASDLALRQTVTGLDAARDALGEDAWKGKVAPALAASQDEQVKARVRAAQAKA